MQAIMTISELRYLLQAAEENSSSEAIILTITTDRKIELADVDEDGEQRVFASNRTSELQAYTEQQS